MTPTEAMTMKIEINGQENLVLPEGEMTVGATLDGLRKMMFEHRMAITEILLDGEVMTGKREQDLADDPASEHERLQVQVVEKGMLVRSILENVQEHLPRISTRLVETTTLFQTGKVEAAFEAIPEVIEALAVIRRSLDNTRTLCALQDPERFEGRMDATRSEELGELLAETNEAIARRDLVTLGDLLEYEFVLRLDEWKQEAEELGEVAEQVFQEPS